jgi:hypothetical protein
MTPYIADNEIYIIIGTNHKLSTIMLETNRIGIAWDSGQI